MTGGSGDGQVGELQAWNNAGRPDTYWGKHPNQFSVRAYIQGVKSAWVSSKIRAAMRKRVGGSWGRLNPKLRESLHDAVFEVIDEYESRNGGQPDDERVIQMRVVLNLLVDDLGWNDEGVHR